MLGKLKDFIHLGPAKQSTIPTMNVATNSQNSRADWELEEPIEPVTLTSPSAIVHLEYDMSDIPPISPGWTRFVCISDTHQHTFEVPPGDVLLHSGDLTGTGTLSGFKITMEWLYNLPHKTKIIIGGNHDLTLQSDWYEENFQSWHRKKEDVTKIMKLLKGDKAVAAGIVYLQDEKYEFQTKENGRTWSVYGSPWSPWFYNWAFNYFRGADAEKLVSGFPKTDILLTHGPPSNIFDVVSGGQHVGCEALASRLPDLRPRIHLFGHIHEAHGAEIRAWVDDIDAYAAAIASSPPISDLITEATASSTERIHDANTDANTDVGTDSESNSSDDLNMERTKLDQILLGNPKGLLTSEATQKSVAEPQIRALNNPQSESLDRTVFVNGANWPAGPRVSKGRVRFGCRPFQPVIVDLKD